MRNRALLRLLALLLGFVVVAAACGSDGDTEAGGTDDSTDETTADESSDEASSGGGQADDDAAAEAMEDASSGDAADAGETPTTMDEWQALWADERQAIVDDITANGWGLGDDGILTGPGGFTIDTNECPADWSDTEGLDGGVHLALTTAQSGQLAAYGNIGLGMQAYFDLVNADGGIDGADIDLVVKDDAYVADQTIEQVAELLQSDKPFTITTLGSPNTFAVYDTLNEACVPQPMVQTGHQAWGDPEGHPWTTGMQLSYASEALLWGSWIAQNYDEPAVVGALVMDNDFGLAYEQAFAQYADDHPEAIASVEFVRHDPAAATLTNEITTLAAEEPNVFISMTAGNPCLLAIQEAGRAGLTDIASALFTPSVCKSIASYMEPAGDVADGWWIVGGGVKDNTDTQYADDAWISFVNSELEAAGLDPAISLQGEGFHRGWAFEQTLKIAAALPGGLTRTNFILALRSEKSMTNPMLLSGIGYGMYGNDDAYLIEGSDISKFDAAEQSWKQQGAVIDLSGQSPNCPWVPGSGC
jgi:branched-chain amino acid transport system substrate-binding protein